MLGSSSLLVISPLHWTHKPIECDRSGRWSVKGDSRCYWLPLYKKEKKMYHLCQSIFLSYTHLEHVQGRVIFTVSTTSKMLLLQLLQVQVFRTPVLPLSHIRRLWLYFLVKKIPYSHNKRVLFYIYLKQSKQQTEVEERVLNGRALGKCNTLNSWHSLAII